MLLLTTPNSKTMAYQDPLSTNLWTALNASQARILHKPLVKIPWAWVVNFLKCRGQKQTQIKRPYTPMIIHHGFSNQQKPCLKILTTRWPRYLRSQWHKVTGGTTISLGFQIIRVIKVKAATSLPTNRATSLLSLWKIIRVDRSVRMPAEIWRWEHWLSSSTQLQAMVRSQDMYRLVISIRMWCLYRLCRLIIRDRKRGGK